jgi:hypothetical protein
MRLFDLPTVRSHLGLPARPDEDAHILDGGYPGETDFLEAARIYAERVWPEAENVDRCSYAGLVAYFATGWYGGYGTDEYQKERQVEALIHAFAGGYPPDEDGILAITPPLDARGEPMLPLDPATWTERALALMETAYFGDGYDAASRQARAEATRVPGQTETWYHARNSLGDPRFSRRQADQ